MCKHINLYVHLLFCQFLIGIFARRWCCWTKYKLQTMTRKAIYIYVIQEYFVVNLCLFFSSNLSVSHSPIFKCTLDLEIYYVWAVYVYMIFFSFLYRSISLSLLHISLFLYCNDSCLCFVVVVASSYSVNIILYTQNNLYCFILPYMCVTKRNNASKANE